MNEININIEGYNVNGICVGCLNYNRKMFYADEVKECYRILGNIDVPDGLAIQVCWECLAAVRHVKKFQKQIMRSFEVLMQYSSQHTFLDSPLDLASHAVARLSICGSECTPQWGGIPFDNDVKPPLDEIKTEVEVPEVCEQPKPGSEPEDAPAEFDTACADAVADAGSSDEEMRLSLLQTKKEAPAKKVKGRPKRRKKSREPPAKPTLAAPTAPTRRLKNLPPDSVELVILTEAEMHAVRADDVRSPEFATLKYKCDNCILGFTSKRLMNLHLEGKHKRKLPTSHQCDVCRAHFATKDSLTSHRAQHHVAYACRRCGHRSTLKRTTLAHLKRCVGASATEAGGGPCDKCDLVFTTKSKLSYHKAVCRQEKPQCDCCGKVFANKLTLKHHLRALSGNRAAVPPSKPKEKVSIQCKGCDKIFDTRKGYRAHVVIHEGLQYPCPVCGKLFQWKRNLARHLRNHADREAGFRHECRECGKRFSSRDCFNNHMRFSKQHVSEDAFVHGCEYCGKKFATKYCLVDHVDWEHLKNIKYQCSVCHKAFKTAKIMVAHMNNIHEGKRKEMESEHLCDICGKSYKTVKRLKGHVWAMHTHRSTVKSFKCKLCPATFTWQTSIYKHVKMMHCNNKRGAKQQRPQQPKAEPYSDLDRMYFQQSLLPNVLGPDMM